MARWLKKKNVNKWEYYIKEHCNLERVLERK